MLQSLLQPRDNQRSKMIGAMPAVAVRHERRRNEKRGGGGGRRPSQLPLQLGRPMDADATPSPDHHRLRNELYVCGKVAALHAVVGSLLLGIVVLVVGLVQLSPGAEAAQHRYYLMGAGAALVGAGILGAVLRCICLHWYNRKFRQETEEDPEPTTHKNGVSVVDGGPDHKSGHHDHKGHDHKGHDHKAGHDKTPHEHKGHDKTPHENKGHDKHGHDHKVVDKPKLKTQASVGRDVDLIKQPSAASDT
ncbi:uncharacterized protein LOC110378772 isoform X3 [Helicoverpa armigera]|uniref:uncharacterized protein LOC110378772 isoform X3 n=1 Tax=Helicoverpa armigera TaxID=29058 RepID=UPI002112E8DC|nr:uncharacterized protein LOC110378772 isoform X3 [Helicoverpa armigera]